MLSRSPDNSNKKEDGVMLVEVQIALIILSVSMLGIAGLYARGTQVGRTSLARHHATTFAGDVADRMRAIHRAGSADTMTGAYNSSIAGGVFA